MARAEGLLILGVRCQFVTSIVWIMGFLGFWPSVSESSSYLTLQVRMDMACRHHRFGSGVIHEVPTQHMGLVELLKSQMHPTVVAYTAKLTIQKRGCSFNRAAAF